MTKTFPLWLTVAALIGLGVGLTLDNVFPATKATRLEAVSHPATFLVVVDPNLHDRWQSVAETGPHGWQVTFRYRDPQEAQIAIGAFIDHFMSVDAAGRTAHERLTSTGR